MEIVRIYEIPDCKMVSSGIGMFGEEKFENFPKWFSSLPATIFPRDFLFEDKGALHWVILYDPSMDVPKEFEIIDFKGGLFAVCCDIDQKTDIEAMDKVRKDFLDKFDYEIDNSRPTMGHIIGSQLTQEVLKYEQMDYWTPIKQKK
ncbi:MAG: AraC family transcriptional regulator [Lachnospiraceae bacterium]|jgi:AraC family transcriptional regulator|nr:AraC family transcriptional regulator [Lachnospiraceae bacterium]